jgi:hypothetical protein
MASAGLEFCRDWIFMSCKQCSMSLRHAANAQCIHAMQIVRNMLHTLQALHNIQAMQQLRSVLRNQQPVWNYHHAAVQLVCNIFQWCSMCTIASCCLDR